MRIISCRITGFQSFEDSQTLTFQEGINIIVGQNNSGKSSLLRSLQFPLRDDRHRNTSKYLKHHLRPPQTHIEVGVSGDECKEAFLQRSAQLKVPIVNNPNSPVHNASQVAPFVEDIFSRNFIHSLLIGSTMQTFLTSYFPSHKLFPLITSPRTAAIIMPSDGGFAFNGLETVSIDGLPDLVFWLYQRKMFFFNAERYSVGTSIHEHATRLLPDASNLPSVLQTLSGERGSLFSRLIDHMREIFFSFGNLSIRPYPEDQSKNEVLVWPTKDMDRPELGFSLESSGTGIAQVLALLTAIMTLDNCIILVDEINSFLHPAATKSLLRIISEYYNKHQYIISTHAPEVISFADNKAVFVVRREGYHSQVTTVDLSTKNNFRDIAALLGISMTDVFAADKMIWVEGPTEELCFPYIFKERVGPMPRGLLVTSATPGDFNKKRRDRELIYEIYLKLSQASSSLTVTVSFSFDTETLTTNDKEKMVADSKGLIHFLPRRHLECYLISSAGIASFINENDKEPETIVTADIVAQTLKELAADQKFFVSAWNDDLADGNWLRVVDAARLINACCTRITGERVVFSKRLHSLFLLKFIMKNEIESIDELVAYVKSLFPVL